MKFTYEPFIQRRFAEGRIFHVNPKMPFEAFVDCFIAEQPFFLVSLLEDGRLAITPNAIVMPISLFVNGYWPKDLFPAGWEYVTVKNGTYPLILTAHPVGRIDEWFRKFEKHVSAFAKETLAEFITSSAEFFPLEFEKLEKIESFQRTPVRQPINV